MVSPGENVAFYVALDMQYTDYFFGIWKVGSEYIISPTIDLHMVTEAGVFILYIPKVETWMAGEVFCELRHRLLRPLFNQFIKTVPARIVPVQRGLTSGQCSISEGRIHKCISLRHIIPDLDDEDEDPVMTERERVRRLYNYPYVDSMLLEQTELTPPPEDPTTPYIDFIYCRFPDGHHFLTFKEHQGISVSFDVQHLNDTFTCDVSNKTKGRHFVDTLFKWEFLKGFHAMKWSYKIELADKSNFYNYMGETNGNSFIMEEVPLEKILKMRVICIPRSYLRGTECLKLRLPPAPGLTRNFYYVTTYPTQCELTNLVVGKGAFGVVSLVYKARRTDRSLYAAKLMKLDNFKKYEASRREMNVLLTLSHPNIVRVEAVFVGGLTSVMVMEFLWGGDLYERIIRPRKNKECDVIPYVRQIVEGLEFLHCKNIVHLDIKPENIICVAHNSTKIKIADFGMARYIERPARATSFYGTNHYISPELLTDGIITVACDMWSLGVMTYVLLSTVIPFRGKEWSEKMQNIITANYKFDYPDFENVTEESTDFIRKLLLVNSSDRLTATQALMHPCLDVHRRQWPRVLPGNEPAQ